MLGDVLVTTDGDGWVGISLGVGVNEEGVTFGVVFAAFEVLRNVDLSTVGGDAFTN